MAICVTAGLQPAIQRTMHGFITNGNKFHKYTYKARRKKYYIGSQKRLPKQTRSILVGKDHNLFKTAWLIRMKRTTTTSITYGHYRYHVLLCQCRTCVHSHSPSLTTPHIANHDDWWMCQSTHGNDKNEYSSPEMRAFINKKQNKIVRKVKKTRQKY